MECTTGNQRLMSVVLARRHDSFGFSISGQFPCLLNNVVEGSSAASRGLKKGDVVVRLNGIDVIEVPHDDVVRLIGTSRGNLELQVLRLSSPREPSTLDKAQSLNVPKPRENQVRHPYAPSTAATYGTSAEEPPPNITVQAPPNRNGVLRDVVNTQGRLQNSLLTTPGRSSTEDTSSDSASISDSASLRRDEISFSNKHAPDYRAVVGYVGSIDLPPDCTAGSKQRDIPALVFRQLNIDHKFHTLLLLELFREGLTLVNFAGIAVRSYSMENIVMCGLCQQDQRFFALLTTTLDSSQSSADSSATSSTSETGDCQKEATKSTTVCHVFMCDPYYSNHELHASKARSFGFNCTFDTRFGVCQEFPINAKRLVRRICKLYCVYGGGAAKRRSACQSLPSSRGNVQFQPRISPSQQFRHPTPNCNQIPARPSSPSTSFQHSLSVHHDYGPVDYVPSAIYANVPLSADVYVTPLSLANENRPPAVPSSVPRHINPATAASAPLRSTPQPQQAASANRCTPAYSPPDVFGGSSRLNHSHAVGQVVPADNRSFSRNVNVLHDNQAVAVSNYKVFPAGIRQDCVNYNEQTVAAAKSCVISPANLPIPVWQLNSTQSVDLEQSQGLYNDNVPGADTLIACHNMTHVDTHAFSVTHSHTHCEAGRTASEKCHSGNGSSAIDSSFFKPGFESAHMQSAQSDQDNEHLTSCTAMPRSQSRVQARVSGANTDANHLIIGKTAFVASEQNFKQENSSCLPPDHRNPVPILEARKTYSECPRVVSQISPLSMDNDCEKLFTDQDYVLLAPNSTPTAGKPCENLPETPERSNPDEMRKQILNVMKKQRSLASSFPQTMTETAGVLPFHRAQLTREPIKARTAYLPTKCSDSSMMPAPRANSRRLDYTGSLDRKICVLKSTGKPDEQSVDNHTVHCASDTEGSVSYVRSNKLSTHSSSSLGNYKLRHLHRFSGPNDRNSDCNKTGSSSASSLFNERITPPLAESESSRLTLLDSSPAKSVDSLPNSKVNTSKLKAIGDSVTELAEKISNISVSGGGLVTNVLSSSFDSSTGNTTIGSSKAPADVSGHGPTDHSFDKVLEAPELLSRFRAFLKQEYAEENLDFWLAVEDYRKLSSSKLKNAAQRIYRDYLHEDAPYSVNVDSRAKKGVVSMLKKPSKDIFDSAQTQIYSLMKTDCYSRFAKAMRHPSARSSRSDLYSTSRGSRDSSPSKLSTASGQSTASTASNKRRMFPFFRYHTVDVPDAENSPATKDKKLSRRRSGWLRKLKPSPRIYREQQHSNGNGKAVVLEKSASEGSTSAPPKRKITFTKDDNAFLDEISKVAGRKLDDQCASFEDKKDWTLPDFLKKGDNNRTQSDGVTGNGAQLVSSRSQEKEEKLSDDVFIDPQPSVPEVYDVTGVDLSNISCLSSQESTMNETVIEVMPQSINQLKNNHFIDSIGSPLPPPPPTPPPSTNICHLAAADFTPPPPTAFWDENSDGNSTNNAGDLDKTCKLPHFTSGDLPVVETRWSCDEGDEVDYTSNGKTYVSPYKRRGNLVGSAVENSELVDSSNQAARTKNSGADSSGTEHPYAPHETFL